ncbi:hypothetical protein [Pseudoalteromonas sp. Of11M-6]|uniref:hypothetical protein n=1 Tax=Pseudoalteromonas sp. Of11M-6 TaxID=2917754 RepID=UPI001EF5DE92|nr:hypothetical protein [Pseudoalteromonas sp. Of11M-6]MCG7554702.1 hypothetical protein [Pseudoalteromonas sp. Of11M-6]
MQTAREDESLPYEDRLLCTLNQLSVLAPENFVRFNDPLIQSCLWRCALDSEVDYSSDETLSKQFTDIVLRLIKHYKNVKGEAALDIVFGVALGKIRLSKKCYDVLSQSLEKLDFEPSPQFIEAIRDRIKEFT